MFSRWTRRPEPEQAAPVQHTGPIFPVFRTVSEMPASTIERYEGELPEPVLRMWREHGIGLVGDGFVRVVDPVAFQADGGVTLRSGVPLFLTALNDTIVWIPESGTFTAMKLRWGAMDIVSERGEDFELALRRFGDPEYQLRVLESRHYTEAVERLGVPDITEGFAYRLPLAMGGRHRASELTLGSSLVTQSILLQADTPALRCYRPSQVEPRDDY
nr:GAD-like domain-containing protein [Auraticoccus cholistanensis]